QWYYWEQRREMGERSEQRITGTEHGARADNGRARKRFLDHPFATSARPDIRRAGLRIGAYAGDQHEASDTGSSSLACKRLCTLLMHGFESYAASLDIRRDRVDDRVSPGNSTGDSTSVTHVSAEEVDPFRARRSWCASRLVGMPNCDAHGGSL